MAEHLPAKDPLMRTTRPTARTAAAVVMAALLLPLTSCSDGSGGTDDRADARTDGAACRIGESDTEVAASPAPAAGDTGTVTVTLTNRGAECVLDGFPAVTLTADGGTEQLGHDEGASAQRLTLAEGAATSFTVTYVRGDGTDQSLDVQAARFALPGASGTHDVPWSYGPVAAKAEGEDGVQATVSAFQQTGD